ncbi:MAG: hypothetical protein M3N91_04030 [Pseudomonadota bacterium]|nr:hypothetical protein [Pseudomonadota bacterium]
MNPESVTQILCFGRRATGCMAVRKHSHEAAALVPSVPVAGHPRDSDWKLIVADMEAEA